MLSKIEERKCDVCEKESARITFQGDWFCRACFYTIDGNGDDEQYITKSD